MVDQRPYLTYLPDAVREGLIAESAIDAALRNALGLRFDLGSSIRSRTSIGTCHPRWCRASARGGAWMRRARPRAVAKPTCVLSPFQAGRKVAVVGPHTNDRTHILGNYLGQICADSFLAQPRADRLRGDRASQCAGRRRSGRHDATGVDVNTGPPAYRRRWCRWRGRVVVFVGGLDTESVEREGKDRFEIGFPGEQPALLRALLALGKPVARALPRWHVTIPDDILASPHLAVVSAGYPGINGGVAIAEALSTCPTAKRSTDGGAFSSHGTQRRDGRQQLQHVSST